MGPGKRLREYRKAPTEREEHLQPFPSAVQARCLASRTSEMSERTIGKGHESLVSINDRTKPCEFGMLLAELSKAHKVGFSHGFSPWTDTMLLETFSSKTRRLLIILGHDWYPIVTHNFDPKTSKGYAAKSPLICQSPRDEYAHALPNSLTSHPDRAIVFMNLYPDFRPPCADCTGEVGADKFVAAFSACCREFAKNYTIDAVVSWGAPVWQALREVTVNGARKKPEGIKAAALSGPFNLESQGLTIPYYPFAHPCHRGNFNQAAHFGKFQNVCSTI